MSDKLNQARLQKGQWWMETYKKYYDADKELSTYFSNESGFDEDSIMAPLKHWIRVLCSGAVKGDTLILYGGAYNLSLLFPACGYFKDFIIIDFLESRVKSAKKWINKESGAFDWSRVAEMVCELEGDSEKWSEKEDTLRCTIKEVIVCEPSDTHPVAPKIPVQADCLIAPFSLEVLSIDQDAFREAIKSLSPLIRVGGCLILIILLECTFGMLGNFKFPFLSLREEFLRQVLIDSCYDIKEFHVTPRINESSYSSIDFSSIAFIVAQKVNEVQ
ncbi:indolethylamine N-methyltransferase-like [Ambystoma mexicanum]|uniref:indolethylamine N-methyltransferase-like n=1 Tax=Ambystoma mexicanum TaxID=8296 RepID=UPI0037E99772